MRASHPEEQGSVERNGASIHYEVTGQGRHTLLLSPTWQIVHSRHWKMQVPYLSRHFRVITYDPVGNGQSDRPTDPERYTLLETVEDAVVVLDATDTEKALAIGFSAGGGLVTALAGLHTERVEGVFAIAPAHPFGVPLPGRDRIAAEFMEEPPADPQGWQKYNFHHWQHDWPDFVKFFMSQMCSDPHSTKGWDDAVGWALETTAEVIAAEGVAPESISLEELEVVYRSIDAPFMIVHGDEDQVINPQSSEILAKMVGADLVTLHACGHNLHGRYPVRINHFIREFADRVFGVPPRVSNWRRGHGRQKRALFISSPIGLGHAQRDMAIADELRVIHPDLEIDWLAQDPVTRVLAAKGDHVHPASTLLASESAHIEDESGEHDLAVFQALRDMDEILLSNFMVIDEVIEAEQYDLVVGDESWEVDYHLHENPNLKKTAYAWLTDFVGYLPMPSRGEREALVAADYNAEMISQIARYRRIRDTAIFVGSPEDIVPDRFGPNLPLIREWTEENYRFSGYITGFDPDDLRNREALRAELGYQPDERVCIVSVGGSGVGSHLLRRVIESYASARRAVSDLRMIIVTGPRLDPETLPTVEGVELREYVPRLYRHLAVCDLAIVQGGLSTTMELTAAKVPFIYVPLRNHFEQNYHVRARLARYGAGRHMDYDDMDPDNLATVVAEEVGRQVDYLDVETDGAVRAAEMIAQLL